MAKIQKNFRLDSDVIEALEALTEDRSKEVKEKLGVTDWNMSAELRSLIMAAYNEKFKQKQ